MGAYKFSGVNIQEAYGIFVSDDRVSSNSIERPPAAKPVFSKDWGDENGIETDTSAPVRFQAKKIIINGYMLANSQADYNSKKAALLTALQAPYLFIYQPETEKTVAGRFSSFSNWERKSRVKNSSKIIIKITIEFDEIVGVSEPVYDVYCGPTSIIPTTEIEVKALLHPAYNPIDGVTFASGTAYRTFNIVKRSDTNISNVTDLMADMFGNVTSKFNFQSTIEMGGFDYDIMSMVNTVPFSINHNFKFLLG